jgi:hypothetical protein
MSEWVKWVVYMSFFLSVNVLWSVSLMNRLHRSISFSHSLSYSLFQ